MTYLRNTAAVFSVVAELAHIFCCGLPVLIAVMSAGSQFGLGGGFVLYHNQIHAYEIHILAGSGLLLAIGLTLHFVSYRIDCRSTGCGHGDCRSVKFRTGWIFNAALLLYIGNIVFYLTSGHWYEPPSFS